MKKQFTFLKTGLACLFLMIGTGALAQSITPDDISAIQPPINGTGTEAIFVYGGDGFTLNATTTSSSDGGDENIPFTDFEWYYRNGANGADGISSLTTASAVVQGTVNNELNVTGLAPGFYTFIAQGKTENDICLSPQEEFTVFVLRPLITTVSATGELIYCTDDLVENTLTATVTYDEDVEWNTLTNLSTNNPTVDQFELRYRWYKVADGGTLDIGAETPFREETTANTDSYTLAEEDDTAVGKWNYYVAVDYTVKASGPYTGVLGGTTPTVIEVTPKPGKPTISITPN